MHKLTKIMLLLVLVGLLVGIRAFEDEIFYNPLLIFFKSLSEHPVLPEFDMLKLLASVSLRYVLNTFLSLGILWVLFQKKEIIKLSAILYSILFVVLMIVFYVLLLYSEAGQHMALFYVRRFLIQPLFLLILVPAFYFQKQK